MIFFVEIVDFKFEQRKPIRKGDSEKEDEKGPTMNGEDENDSDQMSDPPPQLRTGPSSDSSGPEESNKENKPARKRG